VGPEVQALRPDTASANPTALARPEKRTGVVMGEISCINA
jgi:hypothetical protein